MGWHRGCFLPGQHSAPAFRWSNQTRLHQPANTGAGSVFGPPCAALAIVRSPQRRAVDVADWSFERGRTSRAAIRDAANQNENLSMRVEFLGSRPSPRHRALSSMRPGEAPSLVLTGIRIAPVNVNIPLRRSAEANRLTPSTCQPGCRERLRTSLACTVRSYQLTSPGGSAWIRCAGGRAALRAANYCPSDSGERTTN
jgi:hypothetical protein